MTAGDKMPCWGVSLSPSYTAVLLAHTQSCTEAAGSKACLHCCDMLLLALPLGFPNTNEVHSRQKRKP